MYFEPIICVLSNISEVEEGALARRARRRWGLRIWTRRLLGGFWSRMDLKQEDAVEGIAIGQHTQTHYHSYAMDEERLSAAQSHFASNCFPRNIPDARSQNFRFACNSFIRAVPDAIKSDFLIRDTPSPSQPPPPRHKHHRFHPSPRARRAGPPPP